MQKSFLTKKLVKSQKNKTKHRQLEEMMKLEEKKANTRSARHARRAKFVDDWNKHEKEENDSSDEDFDINDPSLKRRYIIRRQKRKKRDEMSDEEEEMTEEQRQERLQQLLKKTENYMRTITMRIRRNYQKSVKGKNKKNKNNNSNNDILSTAEVRAFLQTNDTTSNNNNNNNNNEEAIEQTQSLVGGNLKDYQKIGLRWMVSLNKLRLNGILADEMGLGKTVQVIALFAYLLDVQNINGLHLIVAPLSTLDSWMQHIKQWCPKLTAYCHHGPPLERKLSLSIYILVVLGFNPFFFKLHSGKACFLFLLLFVF